MKAASRDDPPAALMFVLVGCSIGRWWRFFDHDRDRHTPAAIGRGGVGQGQKEKEQRKRKKKNNKCACDKAMPEAG